MPARVDPCLATLVDKPPIGPDWAYEVKWDGYRLAVHIEPGGVRILTRGGYDWTERFPTIVDDARRLAVKTGILDGEAVVLDDKGRSDFGMVLKASSPNTSRSHIGPAAATGGRRSPASAGIASSSSVSSRRQ